MNLSSFCFLLLAAADFTTGFVSVQKHLPFITTKATSNTQLQASGTMGCRPIGIGSAAPKTVITNTDLEKVVDTSDEWIKTRTGIGKRHILLEGETLRDLSVQAAKEAIEMAGIAVEDIDLVICATSSPDDMFGDAPTVAAKLGCDIHTMAFDLTAACSGFLFGAVTAGQFLTGSVKYKNALVIGCDALSRWVDWDDRNTCILFGDGAGAMVLTKDEENPGFLGYAAHSNGNDYEELTLE